MSKALAELTIPDDWHLMPVDPNYHHPLLQHCRHRGQTFSTFYLAPNSVVEHLGRFRARPSDILVASFPKSGTTWLQEIVWRVVHEETAASGHHQSLEYRFPVLETPQIDVMPMRCIHDMEDPRLMKTHLMHHLLPESVHSSGAKVLYVSRDARDVCVSYYHYARLVNFMMYRGTFQEFRASFQRGETLYGPYREHVKSYLDHADTVLCLTYEQLHSDRAEVVRKVAEFLGRTLTDASVQGIVNHTSFDVMKRDPSTNFTHWEDSGLAVRDEEGTFMRKGKVGDWANYFSDADSDAFIKWRNGPL